MRADEVHGVPRVSDAESYGRETRLAVCGHTVYADEDAKLALRRGKQLVCVRCLAELEK